MSESEQEAVNEQSYEQLLIGNKEKKTKKIDKTKDSRWHAVKGLGYSINILCGFQSRAIHRDMPQEFHIILYCNTEIPRLIDKKDKLLKEIHGIK